MEEWFTHAYSSIGYCGIVVIRPCNHKLATEQRVEISGFMPFQVTISNTAEI